MTSATQFVELDGKTHVLAEGSVKTVCYEDVPYSTPYSNTQPEKLCKECAEKAGLQPTGRRWTKEAKDGDAA